METGLKDVWKNFKVGAAINCQILEDKKADNLLRQHFSSLSIENSMKFGLIHPKENLYDWKETDHIINYARKNAFNMRGHTIIWHNQNPSWLFIDEEKEVSKTKLFKRLEDHIIALTQRYNDIVTTWDVLNEAIDTEKGDENGMRLSEWYKICGKEVYEFAFKLMRELSPNAKLFFNDYNNETGQKMEATLRFLSSMLDAGIPIDGVGMQGHWYFNYPDEKTLRNAIERYSALGLEIEFTEVDISIYEWEEATNKTSFFKAKPEDRMIEQGKRYYELFTIASEYPCVKNITTWGLADNYSWLDYFPVEGRKNWPLLFDENYNAKPVVSKLIEEGLNQIRNNK